MTEQTEEEPVTQQPQENTIELTPLDQAEVGDMVMVRQLTRKVRELHSENGGLKAANAHLNTQIQQHLARIAELEALVLEGTKTGESEPPAVEGDATESEGVTANKSAA